MCLHRMADRLYGSLQRECDAHIGRQLASLAAAGTADPTIFLQQASPRSRGQGFLGLWECDAHMGRQLASVAAAGTAYPTIFLQQVTPVLGTKNCGWMFVASCSADKA